MRSIAFIGLKHSGKSGHARRLAEQLELPVFDLDDCILQANPAWKSIRQLYAARGEAWFRKAELTALADLPQGELVLATGGGSMENQALIAKLKQRGMLLLFLDAPEQLLFGRMKKKGLPPFLGSDDPQAVFHRLYEKRRPLALQAADLRIEAGDRKKDELFELIRQSLSPHLLQEKI